MCVCMFVVYIRGQIIIKYFYAFDISVLLLLLTFLVKERNIRSYA